MYVLDASVWVSRFVPADRYYKPSIDWLTRVFDTGGVIAEPLTLLAEVAGALSRRTAAPASGLRAVAEIERLSDVRMVPVNARLARSSALIAAELRLPGVDAIYAALARELSFSLVTWDREQRERATRAVDARTPSELLQEAP